MPRGGHRPGAGRKPGILSRRTIEKARRMRPVGEHAIGVPVSAMCLLSQRKITQLRNDSDFD
jgi:hypothetical protein